MSKVFGVGINDAKYAVTKYDSNKRQTWMCPFYKAWKSILQRCFSRKFQEKQPAYEGCTVCEEWLTFSIFKAWMEKQPWEGRALDKDLLVWGNTLYSPTTCIFIPQEVNNFLTLRDSSEDNVFIGVTYYKTLKKWVAKVSFEGKRLYLGAYPDELSAHLAYLKGKIDVAKRYQLKYSTDESVVQGLSKIILQLETTLNDKQQLRRT